MAKDIEKQDVKSKKDAFYARQKERYPDLNIEDEEELYGRILDDYDEYDGKLSGHKKNEEQLVGLFNKDPRAASFLMRWKNGENPIAVLLAEFGDEFKDALEDPEKLEEFTKAHDSYLERQMKEKELGEMSEKNIDETLQALDDAIKEGGYTDEDAQAAFSLFDKIQSDAIVNKVDKDTWLMFLKGITHDRELEAKTHEAEVKGRNAKINADKVKKVPEKKMPPSIGGQGDISGKAPMKDLGALNRYSGGMQNIWERGKTKR